MEKILQSKIARSEKEEYGGGDKAYIVGGVGWHQGYDG